MARIEILEYPLMPLGFLRHKSKQISRIDSSKVRKLEDQKETKKKKIIFVINIIYFYLNVYS